MHILRLLVLCILLSPTLALGGLPAKKILAASPKTTQKDFLEFMAQNPSYQSYANTMAQEEDSQHWEAQLVKAQNHFLEGSMQRSLKLFQQVAESRHSKDWSTKQQDRILYSLFRLAQVEKKTKMKDRWLRRAIEFSQDAQPTAKSFPPPLILRWKNLKKTLAKKNFALPKGFENFEILKINGRAVESSLGLVRTHNQVQRYSFYSNSHRPYHWVGKAADLEQLNMELTPLVEGDCKGPSKLSEKNIDGALYPEQCLKTNAPIPLEALIKTQSKVLSKKPKNFWQRNKTLLWVSAVVVSGVATWQYLENSGSSQSQPQGRSLPRSLPIGSAIQAEPIQISNQN